MELSDMDGLMKIKNAEGWNQTEKDWELLIQYKASINLVAVLDEQIVGCVTAINYAHTVAWESVNSCSMKPFLNWKNVHP